MDNAEEIYKTVTYFLKNPSLGAIGLAAREKLDNLIFVKT